MTIIEHNKVSNVLIYITVLSLFFKPYDKSKSYKSNNIGLLAINIRISTIAIRTNPNNAKFICNWSISSRGVSFIDLRCMYIGGTYILNIGLGKYLIKRFNEMQQNNV